MRYLGIVICLLPFFCLSQNVLKNANVITVKGVGFSEVCNALLDSGYLIEKKDNDLQTARTEKRMYPSWQAYNATYIINIRIKDSIAYISATFTAPPDGGLFKDDPVKNNVNNKGETRKKALDGVVFIEINKFALGFKKEVNYLIK